ncbi:YIP1 family protein [Sorangium atrum]|uniref:YIP1 family protein n=1 Tax=Sorangium atrum TaxID=2995308 RepID=A0ABT5C963_9BACT|nr:YIP1 family protein [Sorangium aterium]MDC0682974.1 YIP1 family protein [Sorangium aterium]
MMMTTPDERVRALVRDNVINPAEGERLLATMSPRPPQRGWRLALNPFERFGGGAAAAAGLAVAALNVALTRLGVRFDGFLDLHATPAVISYRTALLEQVVAWPLPALLFWTYARLLRRRVRLIDFLGVIGLSRAPIALAAVALGLLAPRLPAGVPAFTPELAVIAVVGTVCLVWSLALLVRGFRNASGLRGAPLIAGLIGLVLLSEILSKVALAHLG